MFKNPLSNLSLFERSCLVLSNRDSVCSILLFLYERVLGGGINRCIQGGEYMRHCDLHCNLHCA